MNQIIGKFLKLIRPEKKQLYQIYAYSIFRGLISLSFPLGIQSIISLLQAGRVSAAWLLLVFVIVAGISFSGILQLLQLRITETIRQRIFARAAFDFAFRIPRFEFEDISKHNAPELMNRFFEVPILQKSISKVLIEVPAAVLQIFFALLVLSFYQSFFISFSLIFLFLVVLVFVLTAKKGIQTSIEESKHKYKAASWLEELARVKDTFKLAGKTDFHLKKMDALSVNYVKARESHYRVLHTQYLILLLFKIFISAALLLIGGYLVLEQKMNIGQFVAAEIIVLLIIDSSEKLILNFDTLYDVFTSLEKIEEVSGMPLQKETDDLQSPMPASGEPIQVEFNAISFKYPGNQNNILHEASTVIKKGERVCIAGENSSGKSTLLQLMLGLYKPDSGTILINGIHAENYHPDKLNPYLGNGLSKHNLFEGTLAENISLGREHITTETMLWAIRNSGLEAYLKNSPEGLNTRLELSGSRLSESIYTKIVLARAVVNRPKLLALEFCIECIEKDEREKIIDFLTDQSNNWTLIIIGNDDYLMHKVDRVIKIEKGKISG
ncbi:MAG TPA: ABC transporter ATP-binding protein/permease [Bacteroidetes bacterium]|nr:ABC transporter ATP-binding protein/permease [Bacteroidota bacterium]